MFSVFRPSLKLGTHSMRGFAMFRFPYALFIPDGFILQSPLKLTSSDTD
jgi:aspartyl/asparaginyl beta-hydroxylase (cupin superfamily)